MKTILCLMIVMLTALSAVADDRTAALEYERKLDKHITLSLRAATLKEVLAEVEKATGMHLLAQREIAEDKATVFVKDQPAQDVLRALAHCFNLGWSASPRTADKPYLRLWMDRDYISSMSDREYRDYVSIMGQFDTDLKETAKYVQSGLQYIPDDAVKAKIDINTPEFVRLKKRRDITKSKPSGAMVLQFLALSGKQRETLYAGDHVTFSGAEISPEALKTWPEATSFDYAVDRTVSGCILRCAGRPGTGTSSIASAYFDFTPYDNQADAAAKQILADSSLDKALPEGTKLATDTAIRFGEGSAAVPGTMSDGLLELAKAANLPIVVQYVSEYKGATADWNKGTVQLPASSAKTVGERLAELGRQHTFAVVHDGQFLVGKSLLWHRQRLAEVPEAKIRAWQKDSCGMPEPTFKACVDMASMRWEQLRLIFSNTRCWFDDQEMLPLLASEYALKIYGTLSEDQKQWLAAGKPLPVTALTPEQQFSFMCGFEAREKPTFEGATDPDWPKTGSISFEVTGYNGARVCASAGMRALGQGWPEEGSFNIPANSSLQEIRKTMDTQMKALLPGMIQKLRGQVTKEHPEFAAKDVSFYTARHCSFTFRLADKTRTSDLIYSEKVQ